MPMNPILRAQALAEEQKKANAAAAAAAAVRPSARRLSTAPTEVVLESAGVLKPPKALSKVPAVPTRLLASLSKVRKDKDKGVTAKAP